MPLLFERGLKQEAQRATYRAPEYNVPPFLQNDQGGHFCILIDSKNTYLVEDIPILLKFLSSFVEFRLIVSEEK